jgi:hypothetical protein
MISPSSESMITSDLATLGEDNRRNLVELDDALRRTNMYRDDRPGAQARRDALADERRRELVMMPLTLSHVFAHRVGRAAAGAVALLAALVGILVVADPLLMQFVAWFVPGLNLGMLAMIVALKVLGVYVLATWVAEAWFARKMRRAIETSTDAYKDLDDLARGPVEIAQHAVARVDGISIGLFLAGATSLTLVCGYIGAIVGAVHELPYAWSLSAVARTGVLERNVDLLAFGIAAAITLAILVGRACKRVRPSALLDMLGHWASLAIAVVLGIVASYGTFHVFVAFGRGHLPSHDMRTIVALAATATIVLATAWSLLRWRRREHARIGLHSGPTKEDR